MLDSDLATLYQVETKRLSDAVRNPTRFSDDVPAHVSRSQLFEVAICDLKTSVMEASVFSVRIH